MTPNRLQYLADLNVLQMLYKKQAQEQSFGGNLASGIAEYIKGQWDPNHPVASTVAFITPSLLSLYGFWWMPFLYEVAEVLGFDFKGLFESLGNELKDFLTNIISTGQKPSEEEIHSKVTDTVSNLASQYFNIKPDMSRLPQLMKDAPSIVKNMQLNLNNDYALIAFASEYENSGKSIFKYAGIASLGAKLIKFFIPKIAFIITRLLVSLGFAAAGGAAATLLGTTQRNQEELVSQPFTISPISPATLSIMKTFRSKTIPPELTEQHMNGINDSWLESGDIDQIDNIIANWIMQAYPGLEKYKNDILESNSMQNMVAKFKNRNKLSSGIDIFTIPLPFNSKIEIINQIVGPFISEHPDLETA